jgi:hypothetical protein
VLQPPHTHHRALNPHIHTFAARPTHTQNRTKIALDWEGLIYPLPFSGGWNLPLLPSLPKPVNNTTPHYFKPVQGKNTHIQHKKASPHTSLISYSYPIGSHTGVTTHAIQPAIEGRQIPGYTHTPLASNAYTHASPFLLQPTSQYIQTSKAGNPSTHARTSSLPGKHMQCTHQGSAFKLGLHASYHRIHGRKASRPCYDYLGAHTHHWIYYILPSETIQTSKQRLFASLHPGVRSFLPPKGGHAGQGTLHP